MKNKKVYRKILLLLKPYKLLSLTSLLLATISVIFTLYTPILIGRCIDQIVGAGQVDFLKLRTLFINIIGIVLVTAIAQWFMNLCNNRITYHIVKNIRIQAFHHMEELPLKYLDGKPYGEIISKIVTDVDQFSDGLLMGFTQLFTGAITILGTLAFMLSINWGITLVVVLITPLSFFVAGFITKKTYRLFQEQSQARGDMTALVEEVVGNLKVVKAFGYEQQAKVKFDIINQILQECSQKATFFSSITNPSTRFINGLVYTGVGLIGAMVAIKGMISIGQLSCFLSYANQYTKPFNEISGVIAEFQNAVACAGRVFAFIEETAQEPDRKDDCVLTNEKVDSTVDLVQVSFSYTLDKPLIQNMNLHVNQGERVAIVGPTGCGKTTLINLLMRFYDLDSGKIKIGDKNINHITRNSLRSSFGMVLQETWLKSGTIAENIAYGKPDATIEQVIAAAKSAHAHSFISKMTQGYDTIISESGGNFSQGQKQLLCIARVMLCLPPMLILDEATSSIDTRTELYIQKAFDQMMLGRTSFIVAHRLSTIREADIILVMKDGKIIEQGKHQNLLQKKGFYAELYNSQFSNS